MVQSGNLPARGFDDLRTFAAFEENPLPAVNTPARAYSITQLRSIERTLLIGRWVAVPFALAQVLTFYLPFPKGILEALLSVIALLATGNLLAMVAYRRISSPVAWRRLGAAMFALDIAFVYALVVLLGFDPDTAIFVLLYVLVLEGAMRYGLAGSMMIMALSTVAYTAREWWGAHQYNYDFMWSSITFRTGIGFLIAGVAGAMATRSQREHERVVELYHVEREAAEALRAMDELKNTFLAAVSHELRTPLTSIFGFAITLQDRTEGLDDSSRQMLDHLVREARTLDALLGDLLDLDRLTRGKVTLRADEADVGGIVKHVAGSWARRTGREIAVNAPALRAVVDERKVERIVENLLSNATKYSPAHVLIEASVEQVEEGVLIVVEDGGPGVPVELRLAIFEPFRRGAESLRHSPGTGIGLSLVERFAVLHGGRAWVESRAGGLGASFRVLLPLRPATVGEDDSPAVH